LLLKKKEKEEEGVQGSILGRYGLSRSTSKSTELIRNSSDQMNGNEQRKGSDLLRGTKKRKCTAKSNSLANLRQFQRSKRTVGHVANYVCQMPV